MRRFPLVLSCLFSVLSLASATREAQAAGPWLDRPLTLPRHDWSFDFGLGIGHYSPPDPFPSVTGVGLNFDGAVGLTHDVQLSFRQGVAFSDGRAVRADRYGRLFDTETYNTGGDTFTNPEVGVRYRFVDGRVAQVGVEGRVYLPFAEGTRIGIMAALPVQFRFGSVARLDTGVYLPILFYDPTATVLSIPARLWFQPSRDLWLGPIFAFRLATPAYPNPWAGPRGLHRWDYPGSDSSLLLGFGLGYQVASAVDLKFQVIFPRITDDAGARNLGGGAGVEVRIE